MANLKKYDGLSTSELARLTRERGLVKPTVLDSGAWAAWLREQDAAPPPEAPTDPALITATVDYKRMSKAQLVDLAVQRGMDVAEANAETKAELADWLLASDAVSEDAQQSADTEG